MSNVKQVEDGFEITTTIPKELVEFVLKQSNEEGYNQTLYNCIYKDHVVIMEKLDLAHDYGLLDKVDNHFGTVVYYKPTKLLKEIKEML